MYKQVHLLKVSNKHAFLSKAKILGYTVTNLDNTYAYVYYNNRDNIVIDDTCIGQRISEESNLLSKTELIIDNWKDISNFSKLDILRNFANVKVPSDKNFDTSKIESIDDVHAFINLSINAFELFDTIKKSKDADRILWSLFRNRDIGDKSLHYLNKYFLYSDNDNFKSCPTSLNSYFGGYIRAKEVSLDCTLDLDNVDRTFNEAFNINSTSVRCMDIVADKVNMHDRLDCADIELMYKIHAKETNFSIFVDNSPLMRLNIDIVSDIIKFSNKHDYGQNNVKLSGKKVEATIFRDEAVENFKYKIEASEVELIIHSDYELAMDIKINTDTDLDTVKSLIWDICKRLEHKNNKIYLELDNN